MNKHEIKKITNGIKSSAKYYGVKCYKKMPKGYTEIKGALTAPKGAIWACNGETILSGKRKKCFVLENWFRKELTNKEDRTMTKNSRKKNIVLSPVVKWVGGKRQLLSDIIPLIPKTFSTYVEPFVGGGAVIFDIQPKKAIINDFNSELINVYKVIKEKPNDLITALEEHERLNSEEYFYEVRALDRNENYNVMTDIEKAARIIYLNKTCFNGLFRVNQAGQFNSPYGKYKNPNIVNMSVVLAMSKYFNENNIKIIDGDYKNALKNLRRGAFVYFDPPYMPISSSSSFTCYTENGFDAKQQIELKEECDKLNSKGVKFLLSNSDHPFIRELYKDYEIITVKAKRSINSNGNKRGEINEVLVRNYD